MAVYDGGNERGNTDQKTQNRKEFEGQDRKEERKTVKKKE